MVAAEKTPEEIAGEIERLKVEAAEKTAQLESEAAEAIAKRERDLSDDPAVIFGDITDDLGLVDCKITGWVRYKTSPPSWQMITTVGDAHFTSADLDLAGRFRQRVMEATNGEPPKKITADAQCDLVKKLNRMATVVEVEPEATDAGLGASWVTHYLDHRNVFDADSEEEMRKHPTVSRREWPFYSNGVTYIYGRDLRRHLRLEHGENVTPNRMGKVLKAAGCKLVKKRLEDETPWVWEIQRELHDPVAANRSRLPKGPRP